MRTEGTGKWTWRSGLLALLWAICSSTGFAQSSPIGYAPLSVCDGVGTGSGGGSTPTTPGRWWNPQRSGTGWDFTYTGGGSNLSLTWYTYDSSRRPVWYLAFPTATEGGATWSAPLHKVTWNGSATALSVVGDVAVTFAPTDPTRVGLRWRLTGQTTIQDECVQDFTRQALRANSSFSGSWYEPLFSGYGVSFTIAQIPDSGYVEVAQLTTYDVNGQPVWLSAQSPFTAAPPSNSLRSFSFFYTYSNYIGGLPTASGASACAASNSCYGVAPNSAGTFQRQFTDSATGAWSVQASGSFSVPGGGVQTIDWRRPAGGTGLVASAKLSDALQISTDRVSCVIPLGQSTCSIGVNYGTNPGQAGYVFRRRLDNNRVQALGTSATGAFTDPVPPGRYRYELRASNSEFGSLLASSAVVQVVETALPEVNTIGHAAAATCSGGVGTGAPGAVGLTPGIWWNPQRSGTGWALNLLGSAQGSQRLGVSWYTYDAQKRPVWLMSHVNQIAEPGNGEQLWWSPLFKVTWNYTTQSRNALLPVGEVSLRLLANDPTRAALRWKWSAAGAASHDECIVDLVRSQGPTAPTAADGNAVRANAAYSGAWYERALSGWGDQITVAPLASGYAEVHTLSLYDSAGEPVWLQGQLNTAGPPVDGVNSTVSLNYFASPFSGGVPTSVCASGSCSATPRPAGSISRSFFGPATGNAQVLASYSGFTGVVNQSLSWLRPATGTGVVAIEKLAEVEQIVVNRTACTLGNPGPCAVVVDFAAGSSYPSARAFRRRLDGAGGVLRLAPNSNTAVHTDTITEAGRYRYELKQWDDPGAPTLALSADVLISAAPQSSEDWLDAAPAAAPAPAATFDVASPDPLVEVGASPGEFRVDESGSATYNLPLYVAPATGGVAPEVALGYASGGGDGVLGVGFSLSGLSAISRCRKTPESGDGPGPHPVVQFNESDAYCLDGQRLIAVGSLGGYGTVYRTELDGLANVVAYTEPGVTGGPAYWSVWGKDGTQRLYGLPGRSHAQANCVAPVTAGATDSCNGRLLRNRFDVDRGTWVTGTEVMSWQLSKIRSRDPAAGAIEFAYQVDALGGEMLLRQIAYSGADNGVRPSATLRFHYAPRLRPGVSLVSGARVRLSQLLHTIESYTADGRLARRYELSHSQNGPSGRPRLDQVREFAENNASYPATRFTWSGAGNAYELPREVGIHDFRKLENYKYGDIDGDGRTDIVWLFGNQGETGTLKISRSVIDAGGLNFSTSLTGFSVRDEVADRERSWQLFDFNQDGREDLLLATFPNGGFSGEWKVHLSNGVSFHPTPVVLPQPLTFVGTNNDESERLTDAALADFDGDGLTDLLLPARINGEIRFQIRTLRRASTSFSCPTGSTSNACPYEFSAPQTLALALPSGASLELRGQDTERYEAFDANGDGRADLRLSIRCTDGCFESAGSLRALALTAEYGVRGYEAVPVDKIPDGDPVKDDIVIRPPLPNTGDYWVVFTHAGAPGEGFNQFSAYAWWKHEGIKAQVSGADENFRLADLNGDSLADVVWEEKGSDSWYYQINRGDGFGAPECVLPRVNGFCPRVDNSETIVLQDYNGDGRLDFWVGQEGGGDQLCAGGSDSNQIYAIQLGNEAGFGTERVCQTQATAFGSDWVRAHADLDGDGQLDVWGTDNPGESSGRYRIIRHATRWQPRDTLTAIVNGLGAETRIDYAPLNFASVYQRDYNGAWLQSGRGAPVFDLIAPQYVVRHVASSAPNSLDAPSDPWARISYRYAGSKSQGGGRGALGMRRVWTLDRQTLVESSTSYLQRWPLNGRPQQSETRLLSALPADACGGPGVIPNGDAPGCMVRSPVCNSDLTQTCDPAHAGVVLGVASDQWNWRVRSGLSSLGAAGAALPAAPVSVFVYQTRSEKQQYELNSDSLTSAGLFKTETTVFEGADLEGQVQPGHDGHGNLLGSSAQVRDAGGVLLKSVRSVFAYTPGSLAPIWVPGLLSQSSVTSSRPGLPAKTRLSRFEYESYGAVRIERIQPGAGPDQALNIHTLRNSYGQPQLKISCSTHFTDVDCTQHTQSNGTLIPTGVLADPADPLSIRRFEAYAYDSASRFVDVSFSAFDSSAGPNSSASVLPASVVLERSLYGEPTRVRDVNNIARRTQYTALGRAYHSYVEGSGSTTLTSTSWCVQPVGASVPTVACPAGAVYRIQVETRGTPVTRSYFDALGREMLKETQGFAAGQWQASAVGYDRLGRVRQQSEPYFSGGADRRLCGASACSRTEYDPLARPILVIAPEDRAGREVRTHTVHGLVSCQVNGQSSVCARTRTTNAKAQVNEVHTSATAEVALSRDTGNFDLHYRHDAHGNVLQVQRTPANGDSAGQVITTQTVFDDLGRRTQLTDPDLGTWSYGYNAAGEQISERNANGQCVTSRYDVRARLVARNDYRSSDCVSQRESASTWTYDSSAGGNRWGLLLEEAETVGGTQRRMEYDSLSRLIGRVDTVEGKTYRQESTYDAFGRAFQSFDLVFLPGDSGAVNASTARRQGVQYLYNAQGYQSAIVNAQLSTDVYYEILASNARGQIVQDRRGGHIALSRTLEFDANTGRLLGIVSGSGGALQNLDYGRGGNVENAYDVLGNLLWREDDRTGLREEFSYDSLNRLTGSTLKLNGLVQASQNFGYDQLGNLLAKGTLSYRNGSYSGIAQSCARPTVGPHMVTRVIDSAVGSTTVYCYDFNGNQVSAGDGNPNSAAPGQRLLKYAVHDKPTEIRTTGASGRLTQYRYGPGREIVRRSDGPLIGAAETTTHYVGGLEITYRPDNGSTTERREYTRHLANYLILKQKIERIGGVLSKTSSRNYRFEDKLGSLDVLADKNGTVVQRMSFDVWGERRNDSTWRPLSLLEIAVFNSATTQKGYTGHEEIDQANLIHMGGRVYDPRIARFLSADPLIQAPLLSQSYNRYSYVLNNPMNYVDPTGYSWLSDNWRTIAAVVISFYMPYMWAYLGTSSLTGAILTGMTAGYVQTGTLKGALIGGFTAGMFHGIGDYFDGVGKGAGSWAFKDKANGVLSASGRAAKIAAHAAAGGVSSVLQGGKFGHGFVSAGFGEAMSPAIGNFESDLGKFSAGVVVGGTSSVLAGGKFANGAVTAAFQWSFNQLAHPTLTGTQQANRERAQQVLDAPEGRAFLDMVQDMEGHDFNVVYGGVTFSDYSKHPGNIGAMRNGVQQSAAGAYAFTLTTWNDVGIRQLGLTDFSPQSQRIAAALLVAKSGALGMLQRGDLWGAVNANAGRWASLASNRPGVWAKTQYRYSDQGHHDWSDMANSYSSNLAIQRLQSW